jgi:Response regulator containing CheY-like receiver domain and AraC-type DNA-binding domain
VSDYPAAEEKRILALVGQRAASVPELFAEAARSVRHIAGEDGSHTEAIIRRLYLNIVSATFACYKWLGIYIDFQDIEEGLQGAPCTAEGFTDALRYVYGWIDKLLPAGAQNVLQNICSRILENPESEISLMSIAEQFYMNHTYLSNTFRQKTGVKFNDYVTSVRMARARYLLAHSDLRIYEISGSLGYKDADYFNRLFKKHNGKTPTDCRRDRQRES